MIVSAAIFLTPQAADAQIETPDKPGLSGAEVEPFVGESGLSDTGFNPDSGIDDEDMRDDDLPATYVPGSGSTLSSDSFTYTVTQQDADVLESEDLKDVSREFFPAGRVTVLNRLEELRDKLETIENADPGVWQTHYNVINRNLNELRMSLDALEASENIEP